MTGGSSESNGPNQRAHNAARDADLNKQQQERFQRELEKEREERSYQELREKAEDIKRGR
jgi:hypothetical protein